MTDSLSPRQALDFLASGRAILIDVREPAEFSAAHIPYAVSVPLAEVSAILRDMALPADRKIIFQCQKGARGGQACVAVGAIAPGGQAVFNLEGGLEAWSAAGLPLVGGVQSAPSISIFRQVQIVIGLLVAIGVIAGFIVSPVGFVVAGLLGGMLAIAGITGWCGLALLLKRAPWNR